jgi:glycosyltransferase involved in cell wall biosynthesis
MNVLMIDSELTWRGGEGQLELLMKGLTENGVAVALAAAPKAAITQRAAKLGVRCLPLTISGGVDLGAAWKLRSYLRKHDFDIVHTHSSHAHSVAFMAQRAPGLRRTVSTARRPALVVSRRVDFPVAKNSFSALKYRHGADIFVAISNGVRDVLLECGVDEERVRIVQSGINLKKFADVKDNRYLLDEFGLTEDTPVIGNVAALAPHKSQVDFISAARKVFDEIDGVRFFIVGEGTLRQKLEARIKKVGMEKAIVLTGFRDDALELMSLFHCFVLSSYLEGLCTSIMDAHAMGVPVVATRTGGVPDLVEDGVTGLLVPPKHPDLLADAMVRMIRNPGLRETCAGAAKTKAESYDYRHMVRGTLEIYQQMLETVASVQ